MASIDQLFGRLESMSPALREAILNSPARPPPPGITPNFVNPPTRNVEGGTAVGVCIFLVAATGLVRVYSKWLTRRMGVEDCAFVVSSPPIDNKVLTSLPHTWLLTRSLLPSSR